MSKYSLNNFGGLQELDKVIKKFISDFKNKNPQYSNFTNAEDVFENYSPVSKRMQEYINSYKKGGGVNYERGLLVLSQKLSHASIVKALNVILSSFGKDTVISDISINFSTSLSTKILKNPENKIYIAKANENFFNKGEEISELGIACWNLFLKLRNNGLYKILENFTNRSSSNSSRQVLTTPIRRNEKPPISNIVNKLDQNNNEDSGEQKQPLNLGSVASLSRLQTQELQPKYDIFINNYVSNEEETNSPTQTFSIKDIMKMNTVESKKVIEKLAFLASYIFSSKEDDPDSSLSTLNDLGQRAASILTGQSGGGTIS